jgi:hypothetical protein
MIIHELDFGANHIRTKYIFGAKARLTVELFFINTLIVKLQEASSSSISVAEIRAGAVKLAKI